MQTLTPKIDDALDELIEVLDIKMIADRYNTSWGTKTREGLKLTIASVLREYGVELTEQSFEEAAASVS